MTLGAFAICQVLDCKVVTGEPFRADRALVLPDALVPARVSTRFTRINIRVVDEFLTHDRAPVSLRAGVVIIVSPFADPAWLATTTVCDLALRCLNTHCFERTSHWIGCSLGAVVTLRALSDRRVWDRVETCRADVTCNTPVDLSVGATVVSLVALHALVVFSAISLLELFFVCSRRTERLSFEAKFTVATLDASYRLLLYFCIAVFADWTSRANCKSSRVGVEAIGTVHFVDEIAAAVLALGAYSAVCKALWC